MARFNILHIAAMNRAVMTVSKSAVAVIALLGLGGVELHANDEVEKPALSEIKLSEKPASCEGKLGVHRTIKVSKKNTFLVGVDNHARLGLKPKELVLTFDDGPIPGTTDRVLKALAAECTKATFFSLGRQARRAPQLLIRAAAEGHTIGTHSQSHPLLTKRKNNSVHEEVRRGVASIDAALEGSGFKASNFFRYPYLGRSKRTDEIVKSYGLIAFHMNIDSWDWKDTTVEEMIQTTLRRTRGEGSGVVLFHDVQERTAIGLPKFLRIIREEGYKIVHIVPGESDFNYREDLARRVPTPIVRPAHSVPVAANDPTDLQTRRNGSPVFQEIKRQAFDDAVLIQSPSGIGGVPATGAVKQLASADPRALATQKLRSSLSGNEVKRTDLDKVEAQKTDTKKAEVADQKVEEKPQRVVALPPLPKRKPFFKRRKNVEKKESAVALRGSQKPAPIETLVTNSVPQETAIAQQSEEPPQLILQPVQPIEKKKKRRFRKLFNVLGGSANR